MNTYRKTKTLILASLLMLGSMTASAVPVKWSVTGLTFGDGGTGSGTFIYNADTGAYSQINITTTAGSALAGTTHIVEHINFPSGSNSVLNMLDSAVGPLQGVVTGMQLVWNGALTNAPGAFAIVSGFEGVCADAVCGPVNPFRFVDSGRITFVPEPGTLALLGIALLGLAFGRKKAVA